MSKRNFRAKLIENRAANKVGLSVVRIIYDDNLTDEFHIDKNRLLIRKIKRKRVVNGSSVVESIVFDEVSTNESIDPEEFDPKDLDCME